VHKKLISSIVVVALLNLVWCYYFKVVTVPEYKQVEEKDKPDEIYLTKLNSARYHFMKNDYFIENDTLYGKGYLIRNRHWMEKLLFQI
jgi:hypothetical protein